MELGVDFLIGEDYWDFLRGKGTFENLLYIFDDVGKNKRFDSGDMGDEEEFFIWHADYLALSYSLYYMKGQVLFLDNSTPFFLNSENITG